MKRVDKTDFYCMSNILDLVFLRNDTNKDFSLSEMKNHMVKIPNIRIKTYLLPKIVHSISFYKILKCTNIESKPKRSRCILNKIFISVCVTHKLKFETKLNKFEF